MTWHFLLANYGNSKGSITLIISCIVPLTNSTKKLSVHTLASTSNNRLNKTVGLLRWKGGVSQSVKPQDDGRFPLSGRLIIVNAGSENGFVENACLIFKAGLATGDYHGQMNQENFTRWLTEKLLPNIPAKSVIVLDNAPYHSVQEDKTPTRSSLKKDIIAWLTKKGINHDANARKFDLFDLVLLHKPPDDQKNYVVDRIIREHGHTPLRTPPYMCELNPIELAWARLKFLIRSQNTTGNFTLSVLKEVTKGAMSLISPDDWKRFCQHVKNIENKFWETDQHMEEVEPLIINLGQDDDSETDDDSDTNDDDDEQH
ncbi:uncharacterized protein LOC115881383 [Sitophilus oryzae]|uniref:Uncharacterized protein LOC115881383 n=1 Tax=Sitophilus oryzae TaxID=7048 RepID=A0A6J2XVS5_SITOR|nr:uncharacterized protein LOC115881383 [Sitophilus oryzae]